MSMKRAGVSAWMREHDRERVRRSHDKTPLTRNHHQNACVKYLN